MPGPGGHHGGGHGPGGPGGFGGPHGGPGPRPPYHGHGYRHRPYHGGCLGCLLPVMGTVALFVTALSILIL